jgi:hypothetical protein
MINNRQNTINSIGILSELERLETDQQGMEETIIDKKITRTERELTKRDLEEWKQINSPQIEILNSLHEQASDLSFWGYGHGVTLIRDDYFMEYIQQETKDRWYGQNSDWLMNNVNWDIAIETLKSDYMSVDFDGIKYWAKNEKE